MPNTASVRRNRSHRSNDKTNVTIVNFTSKSIWTQEKYKKLIINNYNTFPKFPNFITLLRTSF